MPIIDSKVPPLEYFLEDADNIDEQVKRHLEHFVEALYDDRGLFINWAISKIIELDKYETDYGINQGSESSLIYLRQILARYIDEKAGPEEFIEILDWFKGLTNDLLEWKCIDNVLNEIIEKIHAHFNVPRSQLKQVMTVSQEQRIVGGLLDLARDVQDEEDSAQLLEKLEVSRDWVMGDYAQANDPLSMDAATLIALRPRNIDDEFLSLCLEHLNSQDVARRDYETDETAVDRLENLSNLSEFFEADPSIGVAMTAQLIDLSYDDDQCHKAHFAFINMGKVENVDPLILANLARDIILRTSMKIKDSFLKSKFLLEALAEVQWEADVAIAQILQNLFPHELGRAANVVVHQAHIDNANNRGSKAMMFLREAERYAIATNSFARNSKPSVNPLTQAYSRLAHLIHDQIAIPAISGAPLTRLESFSHLNPAGQ